MAIAGQIKPGIYRIKTTHHQDGQQPAGWGLSAWHAHGAERNGSSSWVTVAEGDHWPCEWRVEAGRQPDTWRLKTMGHQAGSQPAGWGLSAWHAHGAVQSLVGKVGASNELDERGPLQSLVGASAEPDEESDGH